MSKHSCCGSPIRILFHVGTHTDVYSLDFEIYVAVCVHVSLNKSAEITLQFEQGWILHIKRKKTAPVSF